MIIVVLGVSASGKSTLGAALATALQWPFFDGDDFHPPQNRALMQSGVPLGDRERKPWLAALARSIGDEARAGRSAVYACSALKRAYRVALMEHFEAAVMRFVFLSVTRAVLLERLAKRRGHFFPPALLDSQLRDLEPPDPTEPAPILSIEATQPVEQSVAEIAAAFALRV
jgi:gluconokinase